MKKLLTTACLFVASVIAIVSFISTIDWYLAQTGVKSFIVDFRSSRKNTETNEWLAAPNRLRQIGAFYGPHVNSFLPTTIAKEFDGLFFIDTTPRARPNPSVKNVAPTSQP